MRFYDIPPSIGEDILQFEKQIKEFQQGQISPVLFKGIRVGQGVYEQREKGTFMLRIRCASGAITPAQLRKVSELSEAYGDSHFHVTTRQEVQLHNVDLSDVIAVHKGLSTVGLAGKGGGGNTIRNITSAHNSGVLKSEVFDVAPYVLSLTSRMLLEKDSWTLPRKFKISFSNTEKDYVNATATCLGFIAQIREDKKGFAVYTSGGMGTVAKEGKLLIDWIPDDQVYYVVKAMKIMFDKHGNRRQRSRAKIKWLWESLGEKKFKEHFFNYFDLLLSIPGLELKLIDHPNQVAAGIGLPKEDVSDSRSFALWKERNVLAQQQKGLFEIRVPLILGDIKNDNGLVLAALLEGFGENTIRLSIDQNLYIRNIPERYLGTIFNAVSRLETLSFQPVFAGNMVVCTGAATCTLGVGLSRNLTDVIQEKLLAGGFDFDQLKPIKINISGCPNACGSHYTADLGLYGRAGKKENRMYPAYNMLIGGDPLNNIMELGEKLVCVAAKQVPDFVFDLVNYYSQNQDKYLTFRDCLRSKEGRKQMLKYFDHYFDLIPTFEEDPEFYRDWGVDETFSILKGQKAECSAGLFDMIDEDFRIIDELKGQYAEKQSNNILARITVHAAHSLLVTRGIESHSDDRSLQSFKQHFVKTGIVAQKFEEPLILLLAEKEEQLLQHKDLIFDLGDTMKTLYEGMDDSLRFDVPTIHGGAPAQEDQALSETEVSVIEAPVPEPANLFKDFRGVSCPMNFVKTKLAMSPMKAGEVLEILLDDGAPVENVPNSVKLEGHLVLEKEQASDGHWSVMIQKV